MAKRVLSMGVQKIKLIKRKKEEKKNGGVLKKLIDYLKSDDYMFAALFSSSLPNSISPTSTVDTKEPFEENNKKLLVKVAEYLKSDCHMYAPLVLDQPSLSTDNSEVNPQTGPKEAATTPAEKVTEKSKQPAKQATNTFREYQDSDSHPLARTVVRQTVSYRQEVVKHIVQHCRSSSGTGAGLETTGARNVVVE